MHANECARSREEADEEGESEEAEVFSLFFHIISRGLTTTEAL